MLSTRFFIFSYFGWELCHLYPLHQLSIDRYLVVAYPIKHRILMNAKVMILWVASIWIVSCIIPASQMFSDFHSPSDKRVLYVFSVIVIILSSVMYSSTYYKLKKQSRNIVLRSSNEIRAQEIRILKEKRFLPTILIIACIAFVCTVPYLVCYVLHTHLGFLTDNVQALWVVYVLCISVFYKKLCSEPLIYFLRLPSYRKTFYVLYCRRK